MTGIEREAVGAVVPRAHNKSRNGHAKEDQSECVILVTAAGAIGAAVSIQRILCLVSGEYLGSNCAKPEWMAPKCLLPEKEDGR